MKRAALGVGVALALAGAAAVVARRAPPSGPVLLVRHLQAPPKEMPPRVDADERALAVASASMTPEERSRALAAIEFATTRIEAGLTPFGLDLSDDDPIEQLRAALRPYLPAINAARALDRGAWFASDLAVRAAPSCESRAPDERCIALAGDDPEDKRARFLAWPASHAVRLDARDAAGAQRCAGMLRARIASDVSPIALVVTGADLALLPNQDQAALQEAATRLGRALAAADKKAPPELEAFARAPHPELVAPWLLLRDHEVLVIPRLSALAAPLPTACP